MEQQQAAEQLQALEQQLREAEAPTRGLRMVPVQHHKILHLIRHGEGTHNVAGRINHDNYKRSDWLDAHLTAHGWDQAKALQAHIEKHAIPVEVVLVSPLTRALETAVGVFGCHTGPLNGDAPLMLAQAAQDGLRPGHPAVAATGCPPFVAYELCREHLGVHPCDRRHGIASKQAMFPAVDFSLCEEEDTLWQAEHRETRAEIQARGRAFMAQVMARPETHIAIVSHSSFLHFMLTSYTEGAPAVVGALHRWFENAELRTVCVADEAAVHERPDPPSHFPGYPAAVKEGPSV